MGEGMLACFLACLLACLLDNPGKLWQHLQPWQPLAISPTPGITFRRSERACLWEAGQAGGSRNTLPRLALEAPRSNQSVQGADTERVRCATALYRGVKQAQVIGSRISGV